MRISMQLNDELVEHKRYGFGKITQEEQETISVLFFKDSISKTFACPSCFQKELRLAEPLAQAEMEHEIATSKRAAAKPDYEF